MMQRPDCLMCILLVFVGLFGVPAAGLEPLSTEEAIRAFQLADPSLVVELAAAEPELFDPVDMAFDEDGRIFVVEMRDFQLGKDGQDGDRLGVVRLLEDRDGDGRFEHSTIFADGLALPTGLTPAFGGVLVACAPDIIFFKDTDGDGKADLRKVMFTGFGKMHGEALLNSLQYHLDNWIHGCGNHSNGHVRPADQPDAAPVGVNDFRIRFRVPRNAKSPEGLIPSDLLVEHTTGGGQYGMTVDDWGRRISTHNSRHVMHMIMPSRYLSRNRFLVAGSLWHSAPNHGAACLVFRISPLEQWREIRRARRLKNKTGDSRPSKYFTSGSGALIYSGDALPGKYDGNSFVGACANNLVHRDVLASKGVTFTARRADNEKDKDFLASPDNYFRPVQFANGPDGALYIVDMCREIIETPLSVPPDIRKIMNWSGGNDRGRIWRVRSKAAKRPKIKALSRVTSADLVPLLGHVNRWYRLTAQRLLVERQDRSVVDPLRSLITKSDGKLARLHALCTLEGLSALDDPVLLRCITDPHWGIRGHGLRCAESALASGAASAKLTDAILALAEDEDVRVRFQLAFALGFMDDPRVPETLVSLARRDAEDSWMRTALLSSTAKCTAPLWKALHADGRPSFPKSSKGLVAFSNELATIIAAKGQPHEVADALAVIADATQAENTWWRVPALAALTEGIKRGGTGRKLSGGTNPANVPRLILRLLADQNSGVRRATRYLAARLPWKESPELTKVIERDIAVALDEDEKHSAADRISAIAFLSCGRADRVLEPLAEVLSAYEPLEIQQAAAEALARTSQVRAAEIMLELERWLQYTPKIRNKVTDLVFGRAAYLPVLLDALEEEVVPAWAIEPARRETLLKHKNKSVAERAKKIFAGSTDEARKKVYDEYLAELKPIEFKGDAVRGKKVFEDNCSACHVLEDVGYVVGPDLKTVLSREPDQLLMDVLIPSAAVTVGYEQYLIETEDGESLSGVIAEETANSITLRQREGEEHKILRSNLAGPPRASRLSMMPEDVEKSVNVQQMADLLVYLKAQE